MTKVANPESKLPKVLALADLNKAIDACIDQAASLSDAIQTVGVQALMHLGAHGDVGPINRFYLGLSKGVRRQALGSWLLAHGALEVNMDNGTRKTMPLKFSKAKKTNPEAALADPWYTHQPEKEISEVFDLQKAIHGLLVRAKGKTVTLHGKVLSVDHAADTLRALAAMAGEEGYKPEVHQDNPNVHLPGPSTTAPAEPAPAAQVADEASVSADTGKPASKKRKAAGVKAQATQAA